jgi:hypothetical protein
MHPILQRDLLGGLIERLPLSTVYLLAFTCKHAWKELVKERSAVVERVVSEKKEDMLFHIFSDVIWELRRSAKHGFLWIGNFEADTRIGDFVREIVASRLIISEMGDDRIDGVELEHMCLTISRVDQRNNEVRIETHHTKGGCDGCEIECDQYWYRSRNEAVTIEIAWMMVKRGFGIYLRNDDLRGIDSVLYEMFSRRHLRRFHVVARKGVTYETWRRAFKEKDLVEYAVKTRR